MIVRTRAQLLFPVVMASLVACFGGAPEFRRNGPDVIVRGATAFYDSVPGDVIFAGGEFEFGVPASAGGDYLGAAGSQTILGRIHGSMRAVGGEIHLRGSVDRNATIAGGSVSVDSGAVIAGNAYLAGGNVTVAGDVRGALSASAGEVFLNGIIGRDVEVSGGSLHIGPRAQIAGNLRYRVPKDKVSIEPGARVAGSTTALPVSKGIGIRGILWLLGILLAGVVVVALFPGFMSQSALLISQRPIRSALIGLAFAICVPIVAVLVGVTIIGLPLALLAGALYFLVISLGDIPFGLWLGGILLRARGGVGRRGVVLNYLVGGALLVLATLIPVVGFLVTGVGALFGIGAMLLQAWSIRRATR